MVWIPAFAGMTKAKIFLTQYTSKHSDPKEDPLDRKKWVNLELKKEARLMGILKAWKKLFSWFRFAIIIFFLPSSSYAVEPFCPGGSNPQASVIWCDDFDDSTPISQKYFEYDDNGGDFIRIAREGIDGSFAMQVKWETGEVTAGSLKRGFGRNPVSSQSHSNTDFYEIYWRQYVKYQAGWTGNPYKLSRATIFAASNWSQAMIAHIWGDGIGDTLIMDPATGIDQSGRLVTTKYNDFNNLRWLGARRGVTQVFSTSLSGQWHCVETRVRLNTAGSADGVFEFWVDGKLEASRTDLNWIGTWRAHGINAVFFENHWNDGAPGPRIRHIDNIVISTQRIGCIDNAPPNPPTGLQVQ